MTYDEWKIYDPSQDYWDGESEEGCTCPMKCGAGGYRLTDKWCPLHGLNPDAEYERERDDNYFQQLHQSDKGIAERERGWDRGEE